MIIHWQNASNFDYRLNLEKSLYLEKCFVTEVVAREHHETFLKSDKR